MAVTLQPVFEALGYVDAKQQRALVKLLQASEAFGDVKGVNGILTDQQADAILHHVTFDSPEQAANLLHEITQEKLIYRAKGKERHDCEDSSFFRQHRTELIEALRDAGMIDEIKPARKHYDHVLLLGAIEGETAGRFEKMKQLWEQGIRFDKIHMLGSERRLHPELEPSSNTTGPEGTPVSTEMRMMESHYYDTKSQWPSGLENVRIFEVNTYNKAGGERPNTQDTVISWKNTHPEAGEVLVISSQPFSRYQDAAVKSVLPSAFHVETVGDAAPQDIKISVALDTLARQIDVGFPQLLEKLKVQKPKLKTELVMLDPASIQVDAATYQFRSGGDAKGVTEKGRFHADQWDPILHGDPILVHERTDGRIFVADGHHRVDLAKKLNETGAGPGKIAATVLKEADGYTAEDVKIIAAYKNIAHGKCDPVDTARVFKEANSGKVNTDLLPHLQMDKGNLRMSYTLSRLSDGALDTVAKGGVPVEIAAKLAEQVPDDHKKQEAVMNIISQKLHQNYKMTENARPTNLQFNVFNFPRDTDLKTLPGFVEKLAAQRAGSASVIITR